MKAGAPPHLFDQFSLNTLTIHIKSLCHQYFWQYFSLCQKLSHFSTRHFHGFFQQKEEIKYFFRQNNRFNSCFMWFTTHIWRKIFESYEDQKKVVWKFLPGFSRIFSMFLFWKAADWWSLRARQYSNSVSAREITQNYRWRYLLVYQNRD